MLAGIAGCQPVPQPFRPGADAPANPLLQLDDRAGIVVLDVDGAPEAMARALPEATMAALQALNVPATTRSANRESRFLYGEAQTSPAGEGRVEVKLTWELVDAKGTPIGRHVVTGPARAAHWSRGEEDVVRRFAEASARGIAAFIQAPRPRAAAPIATLRPLHVMPVTGAGEDQGRILRRAMAEALRKLELNLSPVRRKRDLAMFGEISIGPAAGGRRRLEIAWSVREPGGDEIGNLKQANVVEADALGAKWPDLAKLISDAAAPAIVEVLRRGEDKSGR